MPGGDMHSADGAMSGDMMPMAHMKMTTLGPAHAGDAVRAAAIADTLRGAIEKYRNYHVALDEGFVIFMPKIPQRVYHFTSRPNAFRSIFSFDPARPTSLLYRKTGGGYTLVGAMFTAPNRYGPKDLDARVPLSMAEWHMHRNLCMPPKDRELALYPSGDAPPLFGFQGSIATDSACKAAGGRFHATVFGWMVHVSPWETDPAKVWGTHEDEEERGATGH